MLQTLERRGCLSEEDREAVLALPHRLKTCEAHRYIVREGDRAEHCVLILSGFACRHKVVGDGSRSISAVQMKGDIVDLHNVLLAHADHNVQALTRCELALVTREQIAKIAVERPHVAIAMWYATLVDGSIAREWVANVARRAAPKRIAHLLCEFGVRVEQAGLGDRLSYELPMTQEQLADATGLTPVHVNRVKELERTRVISRHGRYYALADWAQAEETADFNTNYLHMETQEA
jgi:CRP-like cAMP-binding protein